MCFFLMSIFFSYSSSIIFGLFRQLSLITNGIIIFKSQNNDEIFKFFYTSLIFFFSPLTWGYHVSVYVFNYLRVLFCSWYVFSILNFISVFILRCEVPKTENVPKEFFLITLSRGSCEFISWKYSIYYYTLMYEDIRFSSAF